VRAASADAPKEKNVNAAQTKWAPAVRVPAPTDVHAGAAMERTVIVQRPALKVDAVVAAMKKAADTMRAPEADVVATATISARRSDLVQSAEFRV